MSNAQADEPSLLPGWTRAMLVTHLARNADSNARMIRARLRGEDQPQYPGGREQRAADIEAGRGRSAAQVAEDLHGAAAELMEAFQAISPEQWDLVVPAGVGPRPLRQRVRSRRLEVEVHHADLGLAYSVADWPMDFVEAELDRTVRTVPRRRIASAPYGRWAIGDWRIDIGDEVSVRRGVDGSDGAVGGDARYLFAWLIGRAGAEQLEITGDTRVADLPTWFPFP